LFLNKDTSKSLRSVPLDLRWGTIEKMGLEICTYAKKS
jgi:hypothetical protein